MFQKTFIFTFFILILLVGCSMHQFSEAEPDSDWVENSLNNTEPKQKVILGSVTGYDVKVEIEPNGEQYIDVTIWLEVEKGRIDEIKAIVHIFKLNVEEKRWDIYKQVPVFRYDLNQGKHMIIKFEKLPHTNQSMYASFFGNAFQGDLRGVFYDSQNYDL